MVHHKHRSSSNASRYKRHVRHNLRSSRTPNASSTNNTLSSNETNQKRKNQPSSTAWENIVIHYLQKLKNYWGAAAGHPETPARATSAETFRKKHEKRIPRETRGRQPTPYRYSSTTRQSLPRHSSNNNHVDYCQMGKRKALNIVSNALEYGLANGIVSKNGNYYWIKDRLIPKRVSNHRMLAKKDLSAEKMDASNVVQPAVPQGILKKKGRKVPKRGVKRLTIKTGKHAKRNKRPCNCKNCKQTV